jgi:hypothetical protein
MVVGPRDSRFCSRSLTLVRVRHCGGTGHPLYKDFPNRKLAWGAATDGAAMGNHTGPSLAAPALAQALLRAAQPRLRGKAATAQGGGPNRSWGKKNLMSDYRGKVCLSNFAIWCCDGVGVKLWWSGNKPPPIQSSIVYLCVSCSDSRHRSISILDIRRGLVVDRENQQINLDREARQSNSRPINVRLRQM